MFKLLIGDEPVTVFDLVSFCLDAKKVEALKTLSLSDIIVSVERSPEGFVLILKKRDGAN